MVSLSPSWFLWVYLLPVSSGSSFSSQTVFLSLLGTCQASSLHKPFSISLPELSSPRYMHASSYSSIQSPLKGHLPSERLFLTTHVKLHPSLLTPLTPPPAYFNLLIIYHCLSYSLCIIYLPTY